MSQGDLEYIILHLSDIWPLKSEVSTWLCDNVGLKGSMHQFIVDPEVKWCCQQHEIWFKDDTAATMFKLTWGGLC